VSAAILLDTCAVIRVFSAEDEDSPARSHLDEVWRSGASVMVSPISAWEIGMLVSKDRLRLSNPPELWFRRLLETPGVDLADLSPEVLIASSFEPVAALRDPADRIIAATARVRGYRVMTRDRPLLDLGAAGHVQVVAC